MMRQQHHNDDLSNTANAGNIGIHTWCRCRPSNSMATWERHAGLVSRRDAPFIDIKNTAMSTLATVQTVSLPFSNIHILR